MENLSRLSIEMRESFQSEIEKAKSDRNTERELYYKKKIAQLDYEKLEQSESKQLDGQVCEEYERIMEKASSDGNEERKMYYKCKLERLGKEISFGGETLYEKERRRQAQEKYDQKKKMSDSDKREYLRNHPHPTMHQLKTLDELNRKKK